MLILVHNSNEVFEVLDRWCHAADDLVNFARWNPVIDCQLLVNAFIQRIVAVYSASMEWCDLCGVDEIVGEQTNPLSEWSALKYLGGDAYLEALRFSLEVQNLCLEYEESPVVNTDGTAIFDPDIQSPWLINLAEHLRPIHSHISFESFSRKFDRDRVLASQFFAWRAHGWSPN